MGVAVYFLEIRRGTPEEKNDTARLAFEFKREDIAALTLNRAGNSVVIEEREGKWVIHQPVSAEADQSAVDSMASALTEARVERSLAASPDELRSFGLAEPAVTVEVKLKDGALHRIALGDKDYSGLSVYAKLDESKDVVLLPVSVLTSADKSLDDLRDRSVIGISQFEIGSLELVNEAGRIVLAKQDGDWRIESPTAWTADRSEVDSLLTELTSAKATEFVAEPAADPAQYGLDKPAIKVTVRLQDGGDRSVEIGSKTEESYFARRSGGPVFKVEESLYEVLNVKHSDLRDKSIVKLDRDNLKRLEVKNANLKLVAEKADDGRWLVKEPADRKDKEIDADRIFSPLDPGKATEILDNPPAAIAGKMAKPVVEVRLIGGDGKATALSISAADKDIAYVQIKGRREVYKVGRQLLDDLSFKIDDVVR